MHQGKTRVSFCFFQGRASSQVNVVENFGPFAAPITEKLLHKDGIGTTSGVQPRSFFFISGGFYAKSRLRASVYGDEFHNNNK